MVQVPFGGASTTAREKTFIAEFLVELLCSKKSERKRRLLELKYDWEFRRVEGEGKCG